MELGERWQMMEQTGHCSRNLMSKVLSYLSQSDFIIKYKYNFFFFFQFGSKDDQYLPHNICRDEHTPNKHPMTSERLLKTVPSGQHDNPGMNQATSYTSQHLLIIIIIIFLKHCLCLCYANGFYSLPKLVSRKTEADKCLAVTCMSCQLGRVKKKVIISSQSKRSKKA